MENVLKESPQTFTDVNAGAADAAGAVVDENAEPVIPVHDAVALESGNDFIKTCRKYDGYR